MANIYQQQATSDLANKIEYDNPYAKGIEAIGQKLEQKSSEYFSDARKTYEAALNINYQQSANEIAANPQFANNPEALKAELNKLTDKMSSNIIDPDARVNFLATSAIKNGTYVNAALTQFKKSQDEQAKSIAFDNAYSGMDAAGLSTMNVLSGNGTQDDIVSFMASRDNVFNSINSRGRDGNYIFSNEQRLKMKNDFDKNALRAFKAAYVSAPDDQKEILFNRVINDESFTIQTDKGPIEVKPSQILTKEMQMDVNNYIRDEKYKRVAALEKQRKFDKQKALVDFSLNPTKQGLADIKAAFPDLKDTELDKIEKQYAESPNYMAETNAEAMTLAMDQINTIAGDDSVLEDGTPDYSKRFDSFVKANEFISKQSTGKDAQLSYEDAQHLREEAAKVMIDDEERAIRLEAAKDNKSFLEAMSFMDIFRGNMEMDQSIAFENVSKGKKVDNALARMTAKNTIQLAERALSDTSIPSSDRIKNARSIYEKGKEMLIRIKNPEIGDKKVGDKFTMNGVTYEIVSFDNYDVQVRISK